MDFVEKNLLRKYLHSAVLNNFPGSVQRPNSKINFRCNICGDSKISDRKKRGWILEDKNGIFFYCFNCRKGMNGKYWLKKFFPSYYQSFINELFQSNEVLIRKEEEKVEEKKFIEKKRLTEDELKHIKHFHSIAKQCCLSNIAIELCRKRQIPKEVYMEWFICDQGKYKERLIIPYYDKEGKIYYWQGRSLDRREPKYLNRLIENDGIIYNIDFINKNDPVIVTEGAIDSIFIENGISVGSTKFGEKTKEILSKLKCFYWFDHDTTKQTSEIVKKMIVEGKFVFNWMKFIREYGLNSNQKWDVNELFIHLKMKEKFKFSNLKKYFTNNFYDCIYI